MNEITKAVDFFIMGRTFKEEEANEMYYYREILYELVDKETPMKPKNREYVNMAENNFIGLEIGQCNNCDFETTEVHNYCSQCGQKIDWGDENEKEKSE